MPQHHESPESRSVAIEGSFSYPGEDAKTRRRSGADRLPAELPLYRLGKRFIDVALILLSIPLLLLVIGIVSAVVMLSSPGPVFYSHRRIRQNGAFFSMWKFRTMCSQLGRGPGRLPYEPSRRLARSGMRTHKLQVRIREISSLGLLLRRYSMDELPQVWNVFVGQMTLVGPRPIVAAEVEKYGDGFRYYCRVKPGMTGLWQVSGRSELTYPQRVALDCDYVERWSLRRDFVILGRTFFSVTNPDGAY